MPKVSATTSAGEVHKRGQPERGLLPEMQRNLVRRRRTEQALPDADPHLQIPRDAVRLKAPCPRCDNPSTHSLIRRRVWPLRCARAAKAYGWTPASSSRYGRRGEQLPPPEEPVPDGEVGGVKGALIQFIDAAIAQLLY